MCAQAAKLCLKLEIEKKKLTIECFIANARTFCISTTKNIRFLIYCAEFLELKTIVLHQKYIREDSNRHKYWREYIQSRN